MTKKYVLIVEPVSSGRFYLDAVHEIGLGSIGFLPCLPEAGPAYLELRESLVARYVTPKADLVLRPKTDQWEETVRLLAPFADSILAVVVGSEIGVFEADRIARHLQLPGNAPETSALRRDKLQMQEALRRAGLPSIRSCAVRSVEEGLRFAEQLGTYPIVVKNLSGSATAGLHFCDSETQLRGILEQELTETDFFGVRNESVLLQEMISGTEYVVNTVSRGGAHQLTDMWVYNKITVGDLGHAYDSVKLITHPTEEHERIIDAAKQAITALGIEYGPAHSEIMLSPNGPVLIETGARPMGGCFPPPLLKECLGHYIVDRSLEAYLFPERFEKRLHEKYRPSKGFLFKYHLARQEKNRFTSLALLRPASAVDPRRTSDGDVGVASRRPNGRFADDARLAVPDSRGRGNPAAGLSILA